VFTGLVSDIGTIERVTTTPAGRDLRIRCRYDDLSDGESIAVNGACLTVREHGAGWFSAAAVVTTLGRTTIGEWSEGRKVNLERALRMGDRFGGHMVQGHVDGVGRVLRVAQDRDALLIDIELPVGMSELMVAHGSVAVDGVSLTVNSLPAADVLQLSLIEYTVRHTTLGLLKAGDGVQLEADMVGKYVRRLTAAYRDAPDGAALS
jgi:riboflavin synthase